MTLSTSPASLTFEQGVCSITTTETFNTLQYELGCLCSNILHMPDANTTPYYEQIMRCKREIDALATLLMPHIVTPIKKEEGAGHE